MSPDEHDRLGHATSDARKRLMEALPNHDEIHGHVDIEWPDDQPDDN